MSEAIDDMHERLARLQEQCSMDHWWPRLRETRVPVPETVRVEICDERTFQEGLDMPVPDEAILQNAIRNVDGPPAFLRSDITSTKHKMEGGSLVESLDNPIDNIAGVVEQHHLSMGMPMPSSYYVREWLDLWHRYKTFANGATPVAAETRVFLLDGEVHDWGFYWPEDATWGHSATEENWPELWQGTKDRAEEGKYIVWEYASQVAEEFDEGYWSVDFALAENGRWYALDMARGELSWHPEGVEQAQPDPREAFANGEPLGKEGSE